MIFNNGRKEDGKKDAVSLSLIVEVNNP